MSKFKYTYLVYLNEPKSSLCGCIYYGQHTTDNLNDGYIGSGKILRDYLKKYPNGYYRKILNFYNTQEELNKAEYALIHPHLGQPYCLNLTEGGGMRVFPGELHPMYGKHHTEEAKKKIKEARLKQEPTFKGKHHTEEVKEKIRQAKLINPSKYWQGKQLPEDMKQKISNTQIGRIPWNKGKKGSQNSSIKGKHKVWDNKELNKYHYE